MCKLLSIFRLLFRRPVTASEISIANSGTTSTGKPSGT